MNKKSYVIIGAFFVGVLSLSLFANYDRVRQEAATLRAVSLEQQRLIVDGTAPADISAKSNVVATPTSAASPNVILTGGSQMITGVTQAVTVSSPLGITPVAWTNVTTTAPWGRRVNHTSVIFQNEVWVLGGISNVYGNQLNGTWSSPDGITWTQRSLATPWEKVGGGQMRGEHASVVFDNKIWVIGGYRFNNTSGTRMSDIWNSSDGINWTQVTANAPFGLRNNFGLAVFNNKIWLVGNTRIGTTAQPGDIWSSPDGITWTQAATNLPFGLRSDPGFVAFNNKLWLYGGAVTIGSNASPTNDVWSSPDGITWTQVLAAAPWAKRTKATAFVFDGHLWITGGTLPSGGSTQFTDMWSSKDGITWNLEQSVVPGIGYLDSAVAVFDAPSTPQVDLVVSDLEWSQDGIHYTRGVLPTSYNNQAWFRVTIKNKGVMTFTAPLASVFRLYNKQILPTSIIGQISIAPGANIAPGGTLQLVFPELVPNGFSTFVVGAKKTAGTVNLIGFVDALLNVAETDETNNTYPVTVPVSGY